jgi:hypothetical protein
MSRRPPFQFAALPRGLAAADEGLALATGSLDTYFVAELHRIRGALLLIEPADAMAAEAALREALAVARAQGAPELELRAAVPLGASARADGQQRRVPCSPNMSLVPPERGVVPICSMRRRCSRRSPDGMWTAALARSRRRARNG